MGSCSLGRREARNPTVRDKRNVGYALRANPTYTPARAIDGGVGDAGDGGGAVGDDEAVEVDEAVALLLVVAHYLGAHRQLVADLGGGEVVDLAADVDPRSQHDVVGERPVEKARQLARMRQVLAPIERVALAHVGDVLGRPFPSDVERADAERAANRQRDLVGRGALRDGGDGREGIEGGRLGARHGGMAGGAELTAAHHLDVETAICLLGGHRRGLALVDGFVEACLQGAAREEVSAPACHGRVGHVGVDVDAGHEAAREAEAARDLVVVDLVLGVPGAVVGDDGVGLEGRGRHEKSSRDFSVVAGAWSLRARRRPTSAPWAPEFHRAAGSRW